MKMTKNTFLFQQLYVNPFVLNYTRLQTHSFTSTLYLPPYQTPLTQIKFINQIPIIKKIYELIITKASDPDISYEIFEEEEAASLPYCGQ